MSIGKAGKAGTTIEKIHHWMTGIRVSSSRLTLPSASASWTLVSYANHLQVSIIGGNTLRKTGKTSPTRQRMKTTHAFIDIETNAKYDNMNPGTVTVEGFGFECWDHEVLFGKLREQTIIASYAALPNIPGEKILRRLDELEIGAGRLGWNPTRDYEELIEFIGTMGRYLKRHSYLSDFTWQSSLR
jgi:hypothetical protein